ncbi:hypothetical protein AAEP93_010806 [Penicillium crustosum]
MASLSLTSDVESNMELIPGSPPIAAHECDAFNTLDALFTPDTPVSDAPDALKTFPLPRLSQFNQFNTSEEGLEAVNTFARPHGYALTILF